MACFSVCVFCGARAGANADYIKAAEEFGLSIAAHNWRLVFGAGDVGVMGALSKKVKQSNGQVLGVIPKHLMPREQKDTDQNNKPDQTIITETMHERKKVMAMNSDAFVIFPGGIGTLDEFFEILTWRQLGLHQKPIFIFNPSGFWAPLLKLLDHLTSEGFVEAEIQAGLRITHEIDALVEQLEQYQSNG